MDFKERKKNLRTFVNFLDQSTLNVLFFAPLRRFLPCPAPPRRKKGCPDHPCLRPHMFPPSDFIGPKIFLHEAYLTCVSSKLCEFMSNLGKASLRTREWFPHSKNWRWSESWEILGNGQSWEILGKGQSWENVLCFWKALGMSLSQFIHIIGDLRKVGRCFLLFKWKICSGIQASKHLKRSFGVRRESRCLDHKGFSHFSVSGHWKDGSLFTAPCETH